MMLLLLLVAAAASSVRSVLASTGAITSPIPDDCPKGCGNISVPYPFGLKDGCFRPGFDLFCNTSAQPPMLFLPNGTGSSQFTRIMSFGGITVWINAPSQVFNMIGKDGTMSTKKILWTSGAAYAMSSDNSVTVVGCGANAILIDGDTNQTMGACSTTCSVIDKEMTDGLCDGVGCCQIAFLWSVKSYTIQIRVSLSNETAGQQSTTNATAVKVLVGLSYDYDPRAYEFKKQDLYGTASLNDGGIVDAVLEWNVPDVGNCESAQKDKSQYACMDDHSVCDNSTTPGRGYTCYCQFPYYGNAYLPDGCSKGECKFGICSKLSLGLVMGVGIGMGLIFCTLLIIFIRKVWKKRKEKKMKEKYFHQNRGLLLQQLISSNEDIAERTKVFSLEEMKKATNNFDSSRILGHGGHGTVYKGILVDQRVVAIKKSKIEVKGEIDQFINEVAILSRINHRNIVRLFGCCLETEVPLLVYEFISNGTLHDHLHARDSNESLSWEDRLRIAREAAGALSYLHSSAFISIFHRDVKSSNILLDDNLTTKVSDFGASRSIPIDETHVVTVVQGTYGYLDPQYYYTGQLTEKSDVYSFGVILLELLTGNKPISIVNDEEERNLSIRFLRATNDNQHFNLMEARVRMEGTKEELDELAKLACTCLFFESSARPTMKEVEFRLRALERNTKHDTSRTKQIKGGESVRAGSENISCDIFPTSGTKYQANENSSKNYSMEKYMMSSLTLPR